MVFLFFSLTCYTFSATKQGGRKRWGISGCVFWLQVLEVTAGGAWLYRKWGDQNDIIYLEPLLFWSRSLNGLHSDGGSKMALKNPRKWIGEINHKIPRKWHHFMWKSPHPLIRMNGNTRKWGASKSQEDGDSGNFQP